MEGVAFDIEGGHFGVANLDSLFVGVGVEFAANREAFLGRGRCNQLHDRRSACQGPTPPVLRDVTEQAMFDLVPLCAAETYAERSNAQEPYGSCSKDDDGPIGVDFQE
jgi:hypothetical protein